jgi:hypothetical protein
MGLGAERCSGLLTFFRADWGRGARKRLARAIDLRLPSFGLLAGDGNS